MPANSGWTKIELSAKVFGHISQGLYRTPAGAIKELISNAYDAGAENVKIHTGFPAFRAFSCEDNGSGISLEQFEHLMKRGIGNSDKRVADTYSVKYDRPVIGRLGLGLLSLAQICTEFDIISHHETSGKAFRATIRFPAYSREDIDRIIKEKEATKEQLVQHGEYLVETTPYQSDKSGVKIYTNHLRHGFVRRMKELGQYGNLKVFKKNGPYSDFDQFIAAIASLKTKSLFFMSHYDQLLFGLAIASPLLYVGSGRSTVLLNFPPDQFISGAPQVLQIFG